MSLIHWWPLTGGTQDKVGLAHLDSTYTPITPGKIGSCLKTLKTYTCGSMSRRN